MNTRYRGRIASALVVMLVAALGLASSHARAEGDALASELLSIQHAWEKSNYDTADPDAKKRALEELTVRSEALVSKYPGQAEPLVWHGIVLSSYAAAKGGLGALSIATKSRDTLLSAVQLNANALQGSAYTSLGALYFKVPRWPIGFGDHRIASEYLRKALALNPAGIDPNFFYGELLFEDGNYREALGYLQKALAAPDRPDRPLADSGRRREATALVAQVNSKLKG